ncbi:MAG: hypothetical protein KY469_07400 [Actinobacteria bacterium]|nr:hypothetical protein [Actinomycetota bacterium]
MSVRSQRAKRNHPERRRGGSHDGGVDEDDPADRDPPRLTGQPVARSRSDRQLALNDRFGPRGDGHTATTARTEQATAAFQAYIGLLAAASVSLIIVAVRAGAGRPVTALLLWGALAAVSNALPAPATSNVYLSMSSPVNIAIAYLFHPPVAGVLVGVSAVSVWELRGETRLSHALFNRMQMALATTAASAILHLRARPTAATILLAVLAYHLSNWSLVAVAERSARGTPVHRAVAAIIPDRPTAAVTYLMLGAMGVALGMAHDRIGAWAVLLLALPLLSARHALVVSHELSSLEREHRRLADRLVDERDRERVRIAADIHDVTLQSLSATRLTAETIEHAVGNGQHAVAREVSPRLVAGIDTAIQSLRGAIFDLRSRSVDSDGLGNTIQRFARRFSREQNCRVNVEVGVGRWDDISSSLGVLLLESLQEGVVNARRHAAAEDIRVVLSRTSDRISLVVHNDIRNVASDRSNGSGLSLLQQKLAYVGGGLDLVTSERSATLRIDIPLRGRDV